MVLSPEKRGDISLNAYVEKEEERVSLELQFWCDCPPDDSSFSQSSLLIQPSTVYLLCPPALTVGHLEKLIRIKFDLPVSLHAVEFFFVSANCPTGGERFTAEFTLSDLVCIYSCTQSWNRSKKNGFPNVAMTEAKPMRLYFSVRPVSTSRASDEAMPTSNSVSATATPVASSNAIALSTV